MNKLLAILLIFFYLPSNGQDYGNEWIEFTQDYYQFKIADNGIYRITYQDLVNANIPLASINPKNFQIVARGKEVPIYIEGESDGIFNVNDFIEFYGKKNDGWIDSVFYKGKENQPNPYYSLINDSISYFITWNSSTTNRRISSESAIDFGNYFPASFFWKEIVTSYNNSYYDGETFSNRSTDPEYAKSEGWLGNSNSLGNSLNYQLSFKNRYSSGPFIDLEVRFAGQSNWRLVNNGDHHVRISVGGETIDDIFEAYDLRTVNTSFSPTKVISGNNSMIYASIDDRNSEVDRSAIAYIKYSYPHNMVLSNNTEYEFQVDDHNNQSKQYLEFINFNGGNSPVLYDLTNYKRIRVLKTLTTHRALVPNGGSRKDCYITAESNIKSVQLKPISSNNRFVDFDVNSVDSAFIFITHSSLYSAVTQYAAYRANKGYNPMIVDIQDLYFQFGYGIDKNPLAVRNFINYCLEEFNTEPQYLFLVGKSVNHKNTRGTATFNQQAYQENLVPSFGNPTTDNLLTSGLGSTLLESPIPIGRLSANDFNDVTNYLLKVSEYEAAPVAKWMKRAVHFAGGLSLNESNQFESFLTNFGKDFASAPYGGTSLLFKKNTSVPIQTTLSDSIRSVINGGVSMMTFFGHAAATGGFDISIDSPDKLNNRGRYPAILANSCFSGNYHQAGVQSTSEQYVLERNKGSIAFIASGNLGFASTLNTYSAAFYRNFATDNYGKSLAENMIETVKNIQGINPLTTIRLVCLEMSLQGDPAIRLNPHPLPDYEAKSSNVFVSPQEITSELDSFKIAINISNLGIANNDTVEIQLTRKFPVSNSADTTYLIFESNILYENMIEFTLPVDQIRGVGVNQFTLLIDPLNTLLELNELNNRVDFEVIVRSGDLIPVYPYNYSIVGSQGVILKASTAFAIEDELTYQFELDTSAAFSNILKPSITITSTGGVLEWQPSVLQNMPDSAVYFWRVSKVPQPGESPNWRTFSFQYINGEEGWSQDHFDQFVENDYLFINPNQANKRFEFVDNVKELYVYNIGSPGLSQNNDIRYQVDADVRERNACGGTPGFLIAVLDSLSLESWQSPYNNLNQQNYFGQANSDNYCAPNRTRSEKYFLFRQSDTTQMDALRNFLLNEVPDGNYIVAYSWQNVSFSSIWSRDSSILKAFEDLGSTSINSIPDNLPFIFTVKKGDPSTVEEIVGTSTTSSIELRRTLTVSADVGEIKSVEIGPSNNWERLSYQVSALEDVAGDSLRIVLNGIEQNGELDYITEFSDLALDTNIASIANNQNYKGLVLNYKGLDISNQTPPQVERWQVSYQELPDIALVPNIHFKINNDTLQEGRPLELEIAFKNISQTDFDSLLIRYSVINSQNNIIQIPYPRQQPVNADSVFISTISIPTNKLLGNNKLLIEANPGEVVAEQISFNNLGQFDFTIIGDRLNPLVEVTFDGRRILNREIVSAKPEILVSLKDENSYLALDDTAAFSIFLTRPNGQEELLNFGTSNGDILTFIPAQLPDNIAKARISPSLPDDGIYRLRIQAFDKSGNSSGNSDYELEFEVVNKSSISRLVNYPNPFSTSTRFVFTLTGSEVPDQIQIQIMTVTGKVVREIDQFEIGPLHIGNNISQFAWNGKDEFGDQLANGVYLYRVKVKLNGNKLDLKSTEADQFFTKEFGKMYLLR